MSSSPARDAEAQVQEDLVRLDAYREQLGQMVQQHQYLLASKADHLRAKEALEGLDRLAEDPELLIPVGGEAFVRGSPARGAPVLIGIGSGVVVELARPKVVEMLAERLTKIDEAAGELEGQIRILDERVQLIARRVDSMGHAGGEADRPGAATDDVVGD